MSTWCQHDCEQCPADATSLNASRPCGNQPANPTAVPTHRLAVFPQPAHLGAGTTMRLEPVMVAPSVDGLTCGATQNVFPVPALIPSQQQAISHVLLPVVGTQWQCRWVMQPEATWITQSAMAPQQSGLCHPSQASCCQHRSQLGSLHPLADLAQTSKSQDEAQRELTHTSRKENTRLVPEQPSDENINNNQPTSQPRPNFSDILNKAMFNTSSKLMALLEQELDRMDDEDDKDDDEFSDLEEMDTSTKDSKLTAIADGKRT
ncbi:hypothetical protein SMACR_08540 [Sordaria macrospora]|uniref:WGS project CABT00000000 data, contig 2.59 n=2 Tax=Sordaria macrospora TaxID=5147 RepID=F7WA94_SORMK|nr:uncharacterized protein SMAC_08540 [Sordaria macrospora k-hell]KAA8635584.1 hypothetical protein SMACR_08540 [Sordaria macrospora]WPJ66329.1 hypothetical protein SMAC4_08540 [Sordaria macrospora]CCC05288.1 unnamed protein product [Sordaria macrospora k-hell]